MSTRAETSQGNHQCSFFRICRIRNSSYERAQSTARAVRRYHPASPLALRHHQQPIEGSSELEGTGSLQILMLEQHILAANVRGSHLGATHMGTHPFFSLQRSGLEIHPREYMELTCRSNLSSWNVGNPPSSTTSPSTVSVLPVAFNPSASCPSGASDSDSIG